MVRPKVLMLSVVAIVGAAVGGATTLVLKPTNAATKNSREPRGPDDLTDVQSSLRTLRNKVTAMEQRARATERNGAAAVVERESDERGESRAASNDSTVAAPELTEVDIVAGLDEEFAAQEVDPVWSRLATSEARRVLSSHLPRSSTLTSVECRKDMCRVETRHTNAEEYREFSSRSFSSRDSGLWNGGHSSWIVETTPNAVIAVTHIAKEGQDLPEVEFAGN